MGQTRVDLLHLLEDLRDAYPAGLEETIIAETVANSLDSGARHVAFTTDRDGSALAIVDDGQGMTRAQLRRYHDLAATTKRRGKGIGFAGVGIKLALLLCDEVVTETRRGDRAYATTWRLSSRQKAPWSYVDPTGLVGSDTGTGIRLVLTNALSPLLDPGWLVTRLVRGFAALFDPAYDDILAKAYPEAVRFSVDGRTIPRTEGASLRLLGEEEPRDRADLAVKLPRKRKPNAVGWIARVDEPLPDAARGVAISTVGKVIRRGWDWLGITPANGDRITGLIEAPGLAEALQLNKADFVRTGSRGAVYLAYRKAIQEAVRLHLADWGDAPPPQDAKKPKTRPIERNLESVLLGLAEEFPLLGALVERRAGGQKRIPMGDGRATGAMPAPEAAESRGPEPPGEPEPDKEDEPPSQEEPRSPGADTSTTLAPPAGRRRKGRYTLAIRFESRPDSEELGRLVESVVWVNDAHPAWGRASASRAEGYHIALTVAMSLAPLAVAPEHAHAFISTFLTRWGRAADGKRSRRGSRGA